MRDGPAKVCESGSSPLASRFDSGGRMDCNITFLHFYIVKYGDVAKR